MSHTDKGRGYKTGGGGQRPVHPMLDRRTKRNRSRAAQRRAAIQEQS